MALPAWINSSASGPAGGVEAGQSGDLALGPAVAFGAGGGTAYVAGQVGGTMRLAAFDVLCQEQLLDAVVGAGQPMRMLLDAAGRYLVMSTVESGDVEIDIDVGFETAAAARLRSRLVLADATTGRTVGVPVETEEPVLGLVGSPDGSGMYLLGVRITAQQPIGTVVRSLGWSELLAAAGGPGPAWDDLPAGQLPGEPRAIAAGPDGSVLVVTETVTPPTELEPSEVRESRLFRYADRAAISAGTPPEVPTLDRAVDVAAMPDGTSVLVLGPNQLRIAAVPDLRTVATFGLVVEDDPLTDARCLAVDPAGELAVVVDGRRSIAVAVDLDRREVTGEPIALGDFGRAIAVSLAMSPAGTHAVVTSFGDHADLVLVGAAQPTEWELTAGLVRPYCLPGTGEVLARLAGSAFTVSTRDGTGDTGPVAISQVVPAAGGTRYRFGFDGLATDEAAVAQVAWRGDDCVGIGTATLPVTTFDTGVRTALELIPRHELVVESPTGATQAELRFFTPDGAMLIDHVSLAGTAAVAPTATPSSWQPTAGGVTVEASGNGLTIANGGPVPAAAAQLVTSPAGQRYDLHVTARVAAATVDAAVELAFADETGAAAGTTVRLSLDPFDFDDHAATGLVPDGAVEAELRVVVPPGRSVELTTLELSVGTPEEVSLQFVSEAPGDLTMTGVVIRLDSVPPVVPPVPPGGLCASTPTGDGADGKSCYCASCGADRPVKQQEPVVTDAGRPARVAPCPACGSSRVRVGGRVVAHARRIALPRFRALDRPTGVRRGPAIVAELQVGVPLVALNGIADKRAADLTAVGIPDVVALASADPAVVATLPGVSKKTARALIAEAAQLVRDHGVRVPF